MNLFLSYLASPKYTSYLHVFVLALATYNAKDLTGPFAIVMGVLFYVSLHVMTAPYLKLLDNPIIVALFGVVAISYWTQLIF